MKKTIAPATTARAPLRLIDCAKQRRDQEQRDNELILQALLARARNGDVQGLVIWFKEGSGLENLVLTGPYEKPAEAINAAARMTWRLAERQE